MTFKIWEIIGFIALSLLWLIGLWKSSHVLNTRKRRRSKNEPKSATPVDIPIIPILFYTGHVLAFLSVAMRIASDPALYRSAALLAGASQFLLVSLVAYCNFNTEIEPKLIDLSLKHELQTQPRYEDVVSQIRPIWWFENPPLVITGLIFLCVGATLTSLFWALDPFLWISAFGLHLIFYTSAFSQITVLTIHTDDIVFKRWLANPDTMVLPAEKIDRITVDESFFTALWKAAALTITDAQGVGLKLIVKQPDEIKSLIESLPIEQEEITDEEAEKGLSNAN